MRAAAIVREWTTTVQTTLAGHSPSLSAAVALFSLAVVLAKSCWSTCAALCACSGVKPASRRRRWERLLANPRFDPALAQRRLAAVLLGAPVAAPSRLILDETALRGDRLRCLMVSLVWRKRAVPLAWRCYAHGAPRGRLPALVKGLLRQVREAVPVGREVYLLLDRGLAWPATIRQARDYGWKVVARLQGQTRVRDAGGTERRADELVCRGGRARRLEAEVFKKAGWARGWVVACWPARCAEPWLLFSDEADGRRAVRMYACRMRIEEQFRDLKSYGLNWQLSRLRDAARMDRLVVLLCWALLAMACSGVRLVKLGRRGDLTPVRRLAWSLVRLGMGWLTAYLSQGHDPPRMPVPRLHRLHLDLR
jgi:Transposase DDE domain